MTTRKFKVGDVVVWPSGQCYLMVLDSNSIDKLIPVSLEGLRIFMDYDNLERAEESDNVLVLGNMKNTLSKVCKLYNEKGKS